MEMELENFKRILVSMFAFLLSSYFATEELRFAFWGQTAEATIQRDPQVRDQRRGSRKLLQVDYRFIEANGTPRNERDEVSVDWPVPESKKIKVQYLPGVADSSRIEGQFHMRAVWFVVGSIAWLIFEGIRIAREANAPIRRSSR